MIKVELVSENPDGSAVFNLDLSNEDQIAFIRLGVITAIKQGIEEAKKYSPEYKGNE